MLVPALHQYFSQSTLRSEELEVRLLQENDLKSIYDIHRIAEVNQYLPYDTWESFDDAKHWFAKTQERLKDYVAIQLVICEQGSDLVIGTFIIFNYDQEQRECSIGYVLAPSHWGRGIITRVSRTVLGHLHATNLLDQIIASVESENLGSLVVLDKLGFSRIESRSPELPDLLYFGLKFAKN